MYVAIMEASNSFKGPDSRHSCFTALCNVWSDWTGGTKRADVREEIHQSHDVTLSGGH